MNHRQAARKLNTIGRKLDAMSMQDPVNDPAGLGTVTAKETYHDQHQHNQV